MTFSSGAQGPGMEIGEAVKRLQNGLLVTRDAWERCWLRLIHPGDSFQMSPELKAKCAKTDTVGLWSLIGHDTAIPWEPTVEDLLAQDWHVVRTMGFNHAVNEISDGQLMTRAEFGWTFRAVRKLTDKEQAKMSPKGSNGHAEKILGEFVDTGDGKMVLKGPWVPTHVDLLARDWRAWDR